MANYSDFILSLALCIDYRVDCLFVYLGAVHVSAATANCFILADEQSLMSIWHLIYQQAYTIQHNLQMYLKDSRRAIRNSLKELEQVQNNGKL